MKYSIIRVIHSCDFDLVHWVIENAEYLALTIEPGIALFLIDHPSCLNLQTVFSETAAAFPNIAPSKGAKV